MLPDWNKARWKAKMRPILQAKRWNHHSSVSSHLQKVRNQRPTEPSIWKQELAAWGEPYAKWGIIANRLPGKEEPWNEDESRLVMHYLNPGLGILKHKHTWGLGGRIELQPVTATARHTEKMGIFQKKIGTQVMTSHNTISQWRCVAIIITVLDRVCLL